MTDEISADQPDKDLLGDPVDQKDELIGRPGFKKNKENQRTVQVLKAAGWTNERISRHIGCDPKTLRKHFSQELDQAADAAEAEALLAIHDRMKEGNVSAARTVLTLAEKGRAAPPQPKGSGQDPADDDAPQTERLGKKAAMEKRAENPTGGWGELLDKPAGPAH